MKRVTLISVLSSLLWLAFVGEYLRSYFVQDVVSVAEHDIDPPHDHGDVADFYELQSAHGRICLSFEENEDRAYAQADDNDISPPVAPPPKFTFGFNSFAPPARLMVEQSDWAGRWAKQFAGFAGGHEFYRGAHAEGDLSYLILPDWAVLLPMSIVAFACLRRLLSSKRRHRLRLGLCAQCGYDLRASPERCPECGTLTTCARIKR